MNVAGRWKDWVIGLILLFIALAILCTCLILIVKILNSMFKGHIAVVLKRFVYADFPGNIRYSSYIFGNFKECASHCWFPDQALTYYKSKIWKALRILKVNSPLQQCQ